MKYLVPEVSNPPRLVIVEATGFVPENSIPLPEEFRDEEAEWLVVSEVEDEFGELQKQITINEELKAQILAERESAKAVYQEIEQLLNFLKNTDWMVIRQSETGVPVPEDILTQRQQARLRISELRGE